jgi:tRNA(Ile)-lysidine synthase
MEQQFFAQEFVRNFYPDPTKALLVGVSGGADSLCLLHLLKSGGWRVIPAHLDHQLRAVSADQALQLADLLASWDLELLSGNCDVGEYARLNKLGIEEAARICRYNFLFESAREYKAQAVLAAHHRDDQVETVLMHFLRGSGVDGLSGMRKIEMLGQFSEEIPLWRPLLDVPKAEILAYCQEHGISTIDDESNQSTVYFRNRIRHEVAPFLEGLQPGFAEIVARNAKAIANDKEVIEEASERAFQVSLYEQYEGQALLFDREKWRALSRGLQARVLMRSAQTLLPDVRDWGYEIIERVLNGIDSETERQDLKAGLIVEVRENLVAVYKKGFILPNKDHPQLPADSVLKLYPGKSICLDHGWKIRAELLKRAKFEKLDEATKTSPFHAWLNPIDLELPMLVRGAKPGERWSPLGMILQRQKLSDFFINQKIPHYLRRQWPLVTSGGSVIWVAGLRIAQAWRLLGDEPEILHLELVKPEP